MNNEIGRKLTSLTLMTIMLAGGMVIAAPGMVPEAMAAGQLYVSAENALFGNTFGGAQIVEVVVINPAIQRTDIAQGEPTVLIDNNILRMAQAADGNWYGYFGELVAVRKADLADNNLDFGEILAVGVVTNTTGPVFSNQNLDGHGGGVLNSAPTLLSNHTQTDLLNGQIGLDVEANSFMGTTGLTTAESLNLINEWPFIQTYDFTQGTFEVTYEKAGPNETVVLDYNNSDLDDFSGITLDRSSASQGSEIHLTITDNQLNIDPTAENVVVFYVGQDTLTGVGTEEERGVAFMNGTSSAHADGTAFHSITYADKLYNNDFGDNGILKINNNTNSAQNVVINMTRTTADDTISDGAWVLFWETSENSGVFVNADNNDKSNIAVAADAKRGTSATFDYNDSAQSFIVANSFGTIDMDDTSLGGEWNSGETLAVTLIDQDLNKNTASNEDLTLALGHNTMPAMIIGSPLTLGNDTTIESTVNTLSGGMENGNWTSVNSFSKIANVTNASDDGNAGITINGTATVHELRNLVGNATYAFINYDITQLMDADEVPTSVAINDIDGAAAMAATTLTTARGMVEITGMVSEAATLQEDSRLIFNFTGHTADSEDITVGSLFFVDIFTFGMPADTLGTADTNDSGTVANNAIYRMELEETGDNTGEFAGEIDYVMINQLNYDVQATYEGLTPISNEIVIFVHEDMTDEDSPRINYLDLGSDGVSTQIADQVAAPSHDGVVSFDLDNYKIADTVVVTLVDQDMNTDSSLLDVYITSVTDDMVGDGAGTQVVDITFNDQTWTAATAGDTDGSPDNGLFATGFTLVETDVASGTFVGSFQVPSTYYDAGLDTTPTTTGTDIEVNYQDFRNASGESTEVGAGASINANTGSVTFDRTVYPVPYGNETAGERFALHTSAANLNAGTTENALAQGDVTVHVRVTDADYDLSASGEDTISDTMVVLNIERGSNEQQIAIFGNAANPITEVAPDSGVFEYDQAITFADGPDDSACPSVFALGCVLQGDILTVEYVDLNDASGKSQNVTDSATFDLRNGVLQSDKSVYLIGSDMILTLIEPDFDLDNDGAQSVTLDLIEWDSDAATTTMGPKGLNGATGSTSSYVAFDPEPSEFRETGDSTGIFQIVIEIPASLDSNSLDRGEKIDLEYTDWGPAGSDYVGQEDEDIGLTVYTSNFGATIELDQKVYTWTDKVYITIVAPDHNMDSGLVDEIGNTASDPIKVSTRGNELSTYKLVESGADTGIFIGEVILAGMIHDADGDGTNDITSTAGDLTRGASSGPTGGFLAATDNDGLTVSFEFSEDATVVGSALIRWNIGEVQWLEASYPASGTGVIRVIDADMNLNPEAIDNFTVDAWSDSDAGGIDLTVTETNEATGIFEGTVFFTVANDSSGHRLRVAEGDTVTAEYEDNTLPDPYTTADELDITTTTLIGTIVPPLERAPAANLRTVDAFGNSLNAVSVDQQVQVSADLANGQDREQSFAYLVQIQDGDGVTVSLAWITGSLAAGQSFSPALSWIPTESGSYTATAFVWESVDNPTALSPPVSTTISVQ